MLHRTFESYTTSARAFASRRGVVAAGVLVLLPAAGRAQVFSDGTAQLPGLNTAFSENVEFFDVDLDGDADVLIANGGEIGNQRNRLWINQGGLQLGTQGFFVDETVMRLPPGGDASRDVDFVDVDRDGDQDVFVSNSSGVSNQSNRWWINMGGLQGGTPGYFQDQNATRWLNLGVNDGQTAFSSIAPNLALSGGGFVDWSCDSAVGDLDGDGDLDLVQASYGPTSAGKTPLRLFLNDGTGHFEEFNPSGYQLTGTDISNGDPALWCEGSHQQNTTDTTGAEADIAHDTLSVELGDLDGDFDLELVGGEKFKLPRIYENRSDPLAGLAFRDVSHAVFPAGWAPGPGNYEQELADLDNDGDLDLYGVNWNMIDDAVFENLGDGSFAPQQIAVGSARMNEADCFDYDADGDLDVFVVGENATHLIMVNPGAAGGFLPVGTQGLIPDLGFTPSHGADAADIDGDGDWDLLAAGRWGTASLLYLNELEDPDVHAPRVPRIEDVLDRQAGAAPTVVRAQVLDNAPWYGVAAYAVTLEYVHNGGAPLAVPMVWSGGQVFRGEIPGELEGTINYRVRALDAQQNAGLSQTRAYLAAPCAATATSYCTAGTSASGCQALLQATGVPSASATSGFLVTSAAAEGQKAGLFFWGVNGATASPVGTSSSLRCVKGPLSRGGLITSGGTAGACDGTFAYDLNRRWTSQPSQNPGAGAEVRVQLWYRDPLSTSNQVTAYSDALAFTVCP